MALNLSVIMTDSSEAPSPTWLGFTDPMLLTDEGRNIATRLADAARDGLWNTVFAILDADDSLINLSRPGGKSGFTPLHQAAYRGESVAAAELVRRGGWLSFRSASAERPFEIARRRGHGGLANSLVPPSEWQIPESAVRRLEIYLHALIRVRAEDLVQESGLRLPPVEPLTGMREPKMWFPIPGMAGGFSMQLLRAGDDPVLQADSWCRMASGSEERHWVSMRGVRQLDDPFAEPLTERTEIGVE